MDHPRYNSWLKHKDYIMSTVFKSDITIESIISSAFQFGWNAGSNYSKQKITSHNSDYAKCQTCRSNGNEDGRCDMCCHNKPDMYEHLA